MYISIRTHAVSKKKYKKIYINLCIYLYARMLCQQRRKKAESCCLLAYMYITYTYMCI